MRILSNMIFYNLLHRQVLLPFLVHDCVACVTRDWLIAFTKATKCPCKTTMTVLENLKREIGQIHCSSIPLNIYHNIISFDFSVCNLIQFLMPFMQIFMGIMYCFLNWILICVGLIWIIFGFIILSGHKWREQKRATIALHIISPLALLFTITRVNWMCITMWSMHGVVLLYNLGIFLNKKFNKSDEAIELPKNDEVLTPLQSQEVSVVDIPLYSINE